MIKVIDIIRALHEAEVNNIKGSSQDVHDQLRDERNFYREEFDRLLHIVEAQANEGDTTAQAIIGSYRQEFIDAGW